MVFGKRRLHRAQKNSSRTVDGNCQKRKTCKGHLSACAIHRDTELPQASLLALRLSLAFPKPSLLAEGVQWPLEDRFAQYSGGTAQGLHLLPYQVLRHLKSDTIMHDSRFFAKSGRRKKSSTAAHKILFAG